MLKRVLCIFILLIVGSSLVFAKYNLENIPKNSYGTICSSNGKYSAYIVGDVQNLTGQLYLYNSINHSTIKVNNVKGRICALNFSPNNHYLLVNMGTSNIRIGKVIILKNNKIFSTFTFVGEAYFSPDSHYLAYAGTGDIQPIVYIEIPFVTNIYSLNLKSGKVNCLVKAKSTELLSPRGWHGNSIVYSISNLENGKVTENRIKMR